MKLKQILTLLLVIISTSIYAQTLPVPTLLDVKTFTFKGAGALPTINYTVPPGKDRAIAVLVNIDRYHSPSGSNHFLVNDSYNNLQINGSESFNSGGFYHIYPASLASVPISAFSRGFWYTEQYTSIPDNVTITFPSTYFNAAKSAQDDMVVIVASFENVDGYLLQKQVLLPQLN